MARDTAHENELTARLTNAPTVLRVQTLQTIRTAKEAAGVPIAQAPVALDFGYTFVGLDPDGHRLRMFVPEMG